MKLRSGKMILVVPDEPVCDAPIDGFKRRYLPQPSMCILEIEPYPNTTEGLKAEIEDLKEDLEDSQENANGAYDRLTEAHFLIDKLKKEIEDLKAEIDAAPSRATINKYFRGQYFD